MIGKSQFCILFGSILLSVFAFTQFSYADLSFSDEFGSSGADDDEFNKPSDLALSRDGTSLYVVDRDNNRVKIFEITGGSSCPSGMEEVVNDEVCFDDDFGSSGSSDGRFDTPTSLAIDMNNGDIYVADSDNNRVQKFQADGDFDNLTFGSSDDGDDEYLETPSAIAIHQSTDYIYVADSANNSISVFDDNGNFKFTFDDDGSNDRFDEPAGMIIDNDNDILYVSDTDNDRIRMFELTDDSNCPSGTEEVVNDEVCFVDDFGSAGSNDGRFDQPSGLAFDEDDNLLYVADTENNRVQVFEMVSGNTCPSGTDEIIDGVCFVDEFGSSGSNDGMFNSPTGIAFDEDNDLLYVSDRDNNRVQLISTIGNSNSISFSDEFGSSGADDDEFNKPSDLALSRDGTSLYVVDRDNNRVKIFEITGGSSCPSGMEEVVNDEVCFDDDFGSSGSSDGRFDTPTSLAIDMNNGDIYVADSDNNRVQKFQADGDFDNLTFGSSDDGDDEYLETPSAIAIHQSTDYIYVADSANNSISVFDDNGNFKFTFDDDGSNDRFDEPAGMIIDNDNDILYVSDTDNDRIRMFELTDDSNCPSGTEEVVNDEVCFVDDFGSAGSNDGRFDQPSGLAFDEDDNLLYVADTENNRVQVFEMVSGNTCPSGTDEIIDGVCFVDEFGSSGSNDGMFNSPTGIAFDEDNDLLYVSDRDNNRVQIFSLPSDGRSNSSSSGSSSSNDVPLSPKGVSASAASKSSIIVTWDVPNSGDDDPKVTGYRIDSRIGNDSYETLVADTKSVSTSYLHDGLDDGETYRYRIYAINSEGTSGASFTVSAKPGSTSTPAGLTAVPISKSQVMLSWFPPSETFNQSITGYLIERENIPDVLYEEVGSVNGRTTTYVVSGLATDKTYSFVVSANLSLGNTPRSNVASATPQLDSKAPSGSSSSDAITVPTSPRGLSASESSSQIQLSWKEPSSDGNSKITGYKIEVKENSESSYSVLKSNTSATSYTDFDVKVGSTYTYRVYALNSVGTSDSSQVSATPQEATLQLSPLGAFTIDENKTFSFTAKLTDSSIKNASFGLGNNSPAGAKINSSTGLFTWTPTNSQGAKSYVFDIAVTKDSVIDRQSITIIVNDVKVSEPQPPVKEPVEEPTKNVDVDPKELGIASFVDASKDPQSYVDRYESEPAYREWFDENFAEYDSIYHAVGLEKPLLIPASFVDASKDPQSYVDRYESEPAYREWFDENFAEYDSIYHAVGLEKPMVEEKKFGICGPGTKLIDGVCTIVEIPAAKPWWQFW